METFYANEVIQKENVHYTTKIKLPTKKWS